MKIPGMGGIESNSLRSMTPKERILSTLMLEEVDTVPIWATRAVDRSIENKWWYPKLKYFLDNFSDTLCKWGASSGLWFSDPRGIRRETMILKENEEEIVTKEIVETPKGEISCIRRQLKRGHGADMLIKPYLENLKDVKKLLSIPYNPVKPDVSGFFEAEKRLGENGIMHVGIGDPLGTLLSLFGTNRVYYWMKAKPKVFHDLSQIFTNRIIDWTTYLLKKGLGPLFGWAGPELALPPFVSFETFDEVITPYESQICKVIHDYGRFTKVHCHGNVMRVLEKFAEMGVDMTEPCEPPPLGDVILKEAKKLVGDRMCLCGNIPCLERMTWNEVDKIVRNAIKGAAPGGGFMLTTTGGVWSPAQPDSNEVILCE
jgi:uroporphyrinogen-III decarboxylase